MQNLIKICQPPHRKVNKEKLSHKHVHVKMCMCVGVRVLNL